MLIDKIVSEQELSVLLHASLELFSLLLVEARLVVNIVLRQLHVALQDLTSLVDLLHSRVEHLDLVEQELGDFFVAIKHDLRALGVLVAPALRGCPGQSFLRLTLDSLFLAGAAGLVALVLLLLLQVFVLRVFGGLVVLLVLLRNCVLFVFLDRLFCSNATGRLFPAALRALRPAAAGIGDGARGLGRPLLVVLVLVAELRLLVLAFLGSLDAACSVAFGLCLGRSHGKVSSHFLEVLVLALVALDKQADEAPETVALVAVIAERLESAQRVRAVSSADSTLAWTLFAMATLRTICSLGGCLFRAWPILSYILVA